MLRQIYYYLLDSSKNYVVTEIAKGGSRAGCISEVCLNDGSAHPYLFNTYEEAKEASEKRLNQKCQKLDIQKFTIESAELIF